MAFIGSNWWIQMIKQDYIDQIKQLLPSFLQNQRWFADSNSEIEISSWQVLKQDFPALVQILVQTPKSLYQVIVSIHEKDRNIHIGDGFFIGQINSEEKILDVYEIVGDHLLAKYLLDMITNTNYDSQTVRALGLEQSNSSLVYDEKLILKIFRRLHRGTNPEVEMNEALDRVGFNHLAAPVALWKNDDFDFAYLQEFLAGGTEGWALALTSLRDLFASGVSPEEAGGDFFPEAGRLGEMTAKLHSSLAKAFGVYEAEPSQWISSMSTMVENIEDILDPELKDKALDLFSKLSSLSDVGASIRIHGDYHLGQVMRTDLGWFVLDFEGEPALSFDKRRQVRSPLKDIAGFLRSLHYAVEVSKMNQDSLQDQEVDQLGLEWQRRNRNGFLEAYLSSLLIQDLLPQDPMALQILLHLHEMEKAAYEIAYENSQRPNWLPIPLGAFSKLANQTFGK